MGRSRGGLTTKIHALVDANGLPVALKLTEGQAHDGRSAADMLQGLGAGQILIADRAYGGAIVGGLADERRPRFRQHVVKQRPPSYRYQQEVQVGAVLPSSGVTYYEVPAEYGVRDYRYTVVNDRTVLVDPRTHRVIQIIE